MQEKGKENSLCKTKLKLRGKTKKETSLRKIKVKLWGKNEKKVVCARLNLSYGPKQAFNAYYVVRGGARKQKNIKSDSLF